ncbi:hypothetical protein HK097_004589, partial [Rhizophlyctis rosea]
MDARAERLRRRTSSGYGNHTAEEAVANLSQSTNAQPNPFADVQLVRSPLNSPDDINVLVGTWNVATRTPTPEDLKNFDLLPWLSAPVSDASLLNLFSSSDSSEALDEFNTADSSTSRLSAAGRSIAPDIVVLGFQELVTQPSAIFLPHENFVYGAAKIAVKKDAKELGGLEPWIDLATSALNRAYGGKLTSTSSPSYNPTSTDTTSEENQQEETITYEPLCLHRMTALGILLLTRSDPYTRIKISSIRSGSIGTGLLGIYGNKGSVSISLDISLSNDPTDTSSTLPSTSKPVSFCFVNAHLGPHEGESYHDWRNEEISSIFDTLVLHPRNNRHISPRLASNHDALWFLGDTNYRLRGAGSWKSLKSEPLARSHVYDLIDKGDYKTLLSYDELTYIRERLKWPSLKGFLEAPITFLPTYKHHIYHFGKLDFPSEKNKAVDLHHLPASQKHSSKRFPAYCDRILYKANGSLRGSLSSTTPPPPTEPSQTDNESESLLNRLDESTSATEWEDAKRFTSKAVTPLSYRTVQQMGWSDHKPVVGMWT